MLADRLPLTENIQEPLFGITKVLEFPYLIMGTFYEGQPSPNLVRILLLFRHLCLGLTYAFYTKLCLNIPDKSTCDKRGVTVLTATSVQVVSLSVYESQGFQLNLNSLLLQGIS